MVYLQTKNLNLGHFLRVLQWTILALFMDIWSILQPFGIFYGHLVNIVVIWYVFPVLVCSRYQKNLATLFCMSWCCETAGFTQVLRNESSKRISPSAGQGFYTWHKINRKSDIATYVICWHSQVWSSAKLGVDLIRSLTSIVRYL
jgi:hypothetical protein